MTQTYQEMDLGPRIGNWLRATYHGSRAKNVARDFDVSESTAKRWLSGERPTSDVIAQMARRFGWRFVNFVFERAVGTPAMYAEMERFDQRLSMLEAERKTEDARGSLAIARMARPQGGATGDVVPEDAAETAPVADADASGMRP